MNICFSAPAPFFIKRNGTIEGEIIKDEIKTFDFEKGAFIEACFINGETKNLLLNEKLLTCPPPFLSVTDLKGGFLIDFKPLKVFNGFRILAQRKTDAFLITLFEENGLKLSIEAVTGNAYSRLDELNGLIFSDYVIDVKRMGETTFIVVFLKGEKNYIAVYSLNSENSELKKEGIFIADNYELSDVLLIVHNRKDVLLHTVKTIFSLNENLPVLKTEITREKDFSDICEKIIPYAFLEEFTLGTIEYELLSDEIKENADKLRNYLGVFSGVFTPPKWREFDEIGIIRKRAENLYFADYVRAEVTSRKITNLKLSE